MPVGRSEKRSIKLRKLLADPLGNAAFSGIE